jgi:hypothetical protein
LFIAVTIAALAACGGSSNKTATSNASTSASSSGSALSSASSAGVADKGEFCRDLIAHDPGSISDDPNSAKQALQAFSSLTPPDEIKNEWGDFLQFLREISNLGQNDPQIAQVAVRHANSLSKVSLFITGSCTSLASSSASSELSTSDSST